MTPCLKGFEIPVGLPFILLTPIYINKKKQSNSVTNRTADWCANLVFVFEIQTRCIPYWLPSITPLFPQHLQQSTIIHISNGYNLAFVIEIHSCSDGCSIFLTIFFILDFHFVLISLIFNLFYINGCRL
jgi:hypothetical protein